MSDNLRKALQKKAEQVGNATEILVSKTRDWQVIKEHISNRISKIQLTKPQQQKLERYQFIYNELMSGKYSEAEVLNTVCSIYEIGITQAYEDLECSQELFTTVININKAFEMKLLLEEGKKMLRRCKEANDTKNYGSIYKSVVALLKEIQEVEEETPEQFEGHMFEAVFDPRLLGAPDVDMKEVLKAINEKRGKKVKIDMFTDIDFEEVKPND
jgi:hypothetical protein